VRSGLPEMLGYTRRVDMRSRSAGRVSRSKKEVTAVSVVRIIASGEIYVLAREDIDRPLYSPVCEALA
jgi:membrane-anchored protein YejM (alkaline phosphatase superfamily)